MILGLGIEANADEERVDVSSLIGGRETAEAPQSTEQLETTIPELPASWALALREKTPRLSRGVDSGASRRTIQISLDATVPAPRSGLGGASFVLNQLLLSTAGMRFRGKIRVIGDAMVKLRLEEENEHHEAGPDVPLSIDLGAISLPLEEFLDLAPETEIHLRISGGVEVELSCGRLPVASATLFPCGEGLMIKVIEVYGKKVSRRKPSACTDESPADTK